MTGSNTFRHKGFTLIELVIVIVLLGILSAVVVPKFFDIQTYRERAASDEVAGAVRYAQKLAVASGCEVQVRIGADNYVLQQHITDCTSGAFTPLVQHPVTTATFSDVSLVSSPASFIFDAMGRCSTDASVTVGSLTFLVVAETGFVDAP